ncbi:MAG: hypothetical protein ACFFG0_03185 [Candidatus Thorarchaeota archaeon]
MAKKTIKEIGQNNITEDIVYTEDTLASAITKIMRKLQKKPSFFFMVVLDSDEKIKGIIGNKELMEILQDAKEANTDKIKLKGYYKTHIIMDEDEDAVKGLEALKDKKNKGVILIKNKNNNYVGKLLLSSILNQS